MSEFGGLWKHVNNQHVLVPPEDGMWLHKWRRNFKNGHIRFPLLYEGTQKKRKEKNAVFIFLLLRFAGVYT